MTNNPADLLAFRGRVQARTGLSAVEVGIVGDGIHARTGGYHEGAGVLAAIGRYHSGSAHVGSSTEDYSCRLARDRAGLTESANAVDVGADWKQGRAAWLRFNNSLFNLLRAGDPALAAVRAINFSRDGVERKRIDRQYGFGEIDDSLDSVTIHTHIEFYRDTEGKRQGCLDRLDAIIAAAISGSVLPDGDDMSAEAEQKISGIYDILTNCYNDAGKIVSAHVALEDIRAHGQRIEAALKTIGAPTDAQVTAQANIIAKALIASRSNGLTDADHAAVQADLEAVLRRGVGPA